MTHGARAALAVLPFIGFLSFPLAGSDSGTASGTITVNGTTTKLAYAYARTVPGFFDKTKEDVQVVLSDVPLGGKALEDHFERIRMANAGKLHAMEIIFNAAGEPISTAFRDNGFRRASPSGLSSADVFTKKVFDGKTVEGSYKSAKPGEFFENTYAFDVSFRAEITRAQKGLAKGTS